MNNKLNIAICEDLQSEREHLLSVLNQTNIPFNIVNFHNAEDFLSQYQLRKYDLIFMDIFMNGMTGIEAATEIRKLDNQVSIVFTTSSLDYTLESYRLKAMNYLEKPVKYQDILPVLQLVNMQKEYIPKISIHTKNGDRQIPLHDILYFEQKGIKFFVFLADNTMLTGNGKIINFIEQLDDNFFYQCHKSYIVNFSYVKSLNKELQVFEMVKGDNVHIRRDGFWKTKKAYEQFLFTNPDASSLLK